jgi:tripartite-type tricarboxylate transporter receptor subunit TctC
MKTTFFHFLIVALGLALTGVSPTTARAEDFYKGKNIRFIVGFAAGGGYDAYTRMVARYISRYIPGNPSTVVENMDGAGSLIAANHIHSKITPDGLTVGIWNSFLVFMNAMGDPATGIDGRKIKWIGTPGKVSPACAIMGFTGLKTLDDILRSKKPIRMGAVRGGNTVHVPMMLNQWAGANFQIIPGYTGTSKIRIAMRSKEIDGACWTWDSMRSTARSMLDAKGDDPMIPFAISDRWEDPEVRSVPLFTDVFRDEGKRRAFNTWNAPNQFSQPFTLSPGTPKDRVDLLRRAFKATMEDKDFVTDAKKANLTVEYVSGEEADKPVDQIYSMPPEVKESLEFTVRRKKTS